MKSIKEKIIEFEKIAAKSGYHLKYMFREDGSINTVEISDDISLPSILMFWPDKIDDEYSEVCLNSKDEMIDYEILKLCVHIMESLNEK